MASDDFHYQRSYRGSIKTIIFDWCGTLVDPFNILPVVVLQKLLQNHRINVTPNQARLAIGKRLDIHLGVLLKQNDISQQWLTNYRVAPTRTDLDNMLPHLHNLLIESIPHHTQLIPGALDALNWCQNNRILTGITTNLSNVSSQHIVQLHKLVLNTIISGDDLNETDIHGSVTGQRPYPYMLWQAFRNLGIISPHMAIKVDNHALGITEGLNAGCWTIGIASFSSYMNINSPQEYAQLTPEQLQQRLQQSKEKLRQAGAHYVIDTLNDLPSVVEKINQRLSLGERP